MKSYLNQRIRSFSHAFNGLWILVKEEHHGRIHLLAAVIVIFTGFYVGLAHYDWLMVCLAIGLVFSFELINTAVESLGDVVSKDPHPLIKKAKDLSAAAVLVSAMAALVVGVLVFYKYLWP